MNRPHTTRIAIGAIFTECNQLGGVPITLDWFERYELYRDEAVLAVSSGVLGGMLQRLRENEVTRVPLIYASTCPGGPLTADCYNQLKEELLIRLQAAMPVDGVLLPLHGAAAAENAPDLEGDLIKAARQIVGPKVPIVATLDLHAHVTSEMVAHANALIAWETYPHRDAFSTGQRGAQTLLDTLSGRYRPTMIMAKVPVITSAIYGSTENDDPFAQVMRLAKVEEGQGTVLSTSVLLVHPYLDQSEMGSGAIVITDNDAAGAERLARRLAMAYWERRSQLEPQTYTPAEAITAGLKIEGGPVLLVETADCCGGGAAGDSVATLRALLEAKVKELALVSVVDPMAAKICHQARVGKRVSLTLGHQLDSRWGEPITVTGEIIVLSEGTFHYTGGIWDGVIGRMGPSAVLAIGAIQVLITSHGTYEWADEQFRAVNLTPAEAKFIVAKNPMNYQFAYGNIATAIFILNTPGPTPPTIQHIQHGQLQRPFFPKDAEISALSPVVLKSNY